MQTLNFPYLQSHLPIPLTLAREALRGGPPLAKRGANRDTTEAGWQPLPEEDDAIVAAPGYDDDDDDATIVAAASTASVHARRFSAASRSKTDRAAAGGLPSLSGGAIVLGGESTEALFLFRGKKG